MRAGVLNEPGALRQGFPSCNTLIRNQKTPCEPGGTGDQTEKIPRNTQSRVVLGSFSCAKIPTTSQVCLAPTGDGTSDNHVLPNKADSTRPWTSVRRRSMPLCRKVSRV